jgi:hypothetical protein
MEQLANSKSIVKLEYQILQLKSMIQIFINQWMIIIHQNNDQTPKQSKKVNKNQCKTKVKIKYVNQSNWDKVGKRQIHYQMFSI